MTRTLQRLVPLLLVVLVCAVPAAAQQSTRHTGTETHWISDHDGDRREVRLRGNVTFTEAGDWVESLAPGAEAIVEERDGRRTRRVEFTESRGRVEARYSENGVAREMDAAARAWISGLLLRATREGGLGRKQRVQRLRQRGGVAAVLNEAAEARSDVVRRHYLSVLFAGGALSAAELLQTTRFVERQMSNDTDRRLAVTAAMQQGAARDDVAAGIFRVAEAMRSDTDRRLVLTAAIERGLVRGIAATAFFRALGRTRSDTDRRLVLTRLVEAQGAAALHPAFFEAVDAFDSDTDRRLVLSGALRADPRETATLAVIRSTLRMGSSTDRRLVLAAVPATQLRIPRIAAAYRDAGARIGSAADREMVLRRLASGS